MSFSSAVLDTLWPTPCPHCGGLADCSLRSRLCAPCRREVGCLPRWAPPPPGLSAAFWLGAYTGPLGALVRRGKHRPDPEALHEAGALLARAARGRLPAVDAVCAVPTTAVRAWQRGLNSARCLAEPVAEVLDLPLCRPLRRRGRGRQVGRSSAQRWARAATSYRAAGPVAGSWLLIDDVWTTGATAAACAQELLGAGAHRVVFLAATRADRAQGPAAPP